MLRHEKKARRRGHLLIAGIDEAGRGPLAGPVVASAVILKDHRFTSYINDSKQLTPKMRLLAFQEIRKKAVIGIAMIGEAIIDRINIRQATLMAMREAVLCLAVEPDCLLIDGRDGIDLPYPQERIKGGDAQSLSIAAASIVAKVTRDALMREYHGLYPIYRFDLHKGYGTKIHIAAIRKHGRSPIHRLSFKI